MLAGVKQPRYEAIPVGGEDDKDAGDPFVDVDDGDEEGLEEPLLYKFKPSASMPELRLYTSRTSNAALKSTLRNDCLLIVNSQVGSTTGWWWYVYSQGFEGWVYIGGSDKEMRHFEQCESIKRYEDWRGNNYFFLDGRIMLGSDAKLLLLSYSLILVPSFIFFWYVLPYPILPCFVTTTTISIPFLFLSLLL
jgi:hypothetical protein